MSSLESGFIIEKQFSVPVLVIGFNRPEYVATVLRSLQKIQPAKVYFAVDGPRPSVSEDVELVRQTHQAIKEISWKCEIRTLFRDKNLGCKLGVSSAISWAFETEEKLIILEDDVVPSLTFFRFCDELLDKYKTNESVLAVSGSNFLNTSDQNSYRFSHVTHVWGWATWKNRWQLYTTDMGDLTNSLSIFKIFKCSGYSMLASIKWRKIFNMVTKGEIDTWDYQLVALAMSKNLVSATSNQNLTENIGFGSQATHTSEKPWFILPAENLTFPLMHPEVKANWKHERWINRNAMGANWRALLKLAIKYYLRKIND